MTGPGPAATAAASPDDDPCCLRLVRAVPVVLLTLVAGFFRSVTRVTRLSGPWN